MINGAWDVVMLGLIVYYYVETKGKTLEEIDVIFEGEKHSDVPDLEVIYRGKGSLSEAVVQEVQEVREGKD
jgi:hypothetical protein